MKKNLYFTLIFVTILLFTGCKKNIVGTPLPDTNTNPEIDSLEDTNTIPDWAKVTEKDEKLYSNLNLDGIGTNDDTIFISSLELGTQSDSVVILRIQLGTGEVLAKVYNYSSMIPTVITGALQSVDKDTIVVNLLDSTSNYTDTRLSILEVIPASEGESARLFEHLSLYGDINNPQNQEAGTILEHPIVTGTTLIHTDGKALKELEVPLLNIDDRDNNFCATIKWEDGKWIILQQPDISSTLFAQMPDTFNFLSGAGAWQTQLYLKEDGSFTGIFSDTDAGDADSQKWSNGTVYICEFSGIFTKPEKVDDNTYSVHVQSLEYAEPDMVTYEDGYRYITSEPYGLDNVDEVLIYLPGYPISELTEEVFSWIRKSGEEFWSLDYPETLPFYALNNVNEQMGFSSKTQSDQ